MTKTKIKKQKKRAFNKDIYLLGIDESGVKHWLESASWDCGWYWGFGYVETYTNNNNPEIAKDISSHSHWDTCIVGKQAHSHLNDNPNFISTTLSDTESWELSELMQSFYSLKEAAAIFGRGKSHIANTEINYEDKEITNKINKEILPKIFQRIYEILSP